MSLAVKHAIFWILPILYSLLLMGLYFSGDHELVDWIAPRTGTEPWTVSGDRELGLLENTQHLLLLGCVLMLARLVMRAQVPLQRIGAALATCICAFMFLEEIDYGVHYRDWLLARESFGGDVNFHNVTGKTGQMKKIADTIMVIWFLLLPMIGGFSKSRWVRYLAPPRMIIFTVIAALLVSKMAHTLDDQGLGIRAALSNNISEFREMFTYYIWFLYCCIMVGREWPGQSAPESSAEAK